MDQNLIYAKTPIGDEAVRQSTRVVQRNLRMVLGQVDGKLSVSELGAKIGDPRLVESALNELEEGGYIAPTLEAVSVWQESKLRVERLKASAASGISSFGAKSGAAGGSRQETSAASNFSTFGKPILPAGQRNGNAAEPEADEDRSGTRRSPVVILLLGHAPDFVLVDLAPPQAEAAGHRELMATLSIASRTARAAARRQVVAAARRVERPGVRVSVSYRERVIAGVTNDSLRTSRGEQAIARSLGAAAVVPLGVVSPRFSEDFGSFQEIVPGAMFLLGVSNRERGWVGMPHSAGYVADVAIRHGGLALVAVLLDRLRRAD